MEIDDKNDQEVGRKATGLQGSLHRRNSKKLIALDRFGSHSKASLKLEQ